MEKKLEWTKPILVELGNAKKVSSGQATECGAGSGVIYSEQ